MHRLKQQLPLCSYTHSAIPSVSSHLAHLVIPEGAHTELTRPLDPTLPFRGRDLDEPRSLVRGCAGRHLALVLRSRSQVQYSVPTHIDPPMGRLHILCGLVCCGLALCVLYGSGSVWLERRGDRRPLQGTMVPSLAAAWAARRNGDC